MRRRLRLRLRLRRLCVSCVVIHGEKEKKTAKRMREVRREITPGRGSRRRRGWIPAWGYLRWSRWLPGERGVDGARASLGAGDGGETLRRTAREMASDDDASPAV